jgi:splicing factor U2AF subunit
MMLFVVCCLLFCSRRRRRRRRGLFRRPSSRGARAHIETADFFVFFFFLFVVIVVVVVVVIFVFVTTQSPEQARLLGGNLQQAANATEPREIQEHYEDFCHDVFEELAVHGEIEELNVCDNLADHMVGNVYVKFADEDDANKAKAALDGRYYMGRPIRCEFSPVTDFRESTCRQYEENTCTRGGYCNFMHLRPIKNATLAHALFGRYGKKRQDRRVYGNRGGGRRGGGGGGGQRRDPYHRRDNRGRDRGYGGDRRRDNYYDHRDDRGRGRDDDRGGGRRGRSRSRSRDRRGGGRDYDNDGNDDRRGGGGGEKKSGGFGMSDEERRAMIASFKNEEEK